MTKFSGGECCVITMTPRISSFVVLTASANFKNFVKIILIMMAFYRLLLLEVVITRYKGNIVISTVITRKQLVLQRAVDHDKSVISCYKDSDYQNLTSYG